MKPLLVCLLSGLLPSLAMAQQRLHVNDKKAPENQADLEAIQNALIAALPKARAATVCIDLGEGSGSGVIISEDGLVLTAAHVSTGVNKDLTVILEDGRKLKAESLGLVADSDAAMVRILEKGPFPFAPIDRENTTKLGDWVFSLGHSGGFEQERGAVARLGRLVRIANKTWQSDCILIGGDSGGPLFDMNGRVIGIHSRVGMQLQVNMHVPMHEFLSNWDAMLASEFVGEGPFAQKPEKGSGFLGVATEAHDDGLKVTKVGRESPAEKAGVKEGDILKTLNGTKLEDRDQFQSLLQEMAADDKITLEMLRDGKSQTLTLKLGAR